MGTYLKILLVGCFMAAATPAAAYHVKTTEDGEIIRWRQPTVQLTLDSSLELVGRLEEVEAAVEETVALWVNQGGVPVEFEFKYEDCGGIGFSQNGSNENCILASDSADFWDSETEDVPGATTVLSYDPSNGAIKDADIVLNVADWNWTVEGGEDGKLDVHSVLVHEMGHLLGLAHSNIPDAVMYPTTHLGDSFDSNLHVDDVSAIDEAYEGYEEEMHALLTPTNCTSSVVGHNSSALPMFLFILAVMYCIRRSLRNRIDFVTTSVKKNL